MHKRPRSFIDEVVRSKAMQKMGLLCQSDGAICLLLQENINTFYSVKF